MYDLEFGSQHGMWDLCWESGVKYLRLGKDVVLILAVFKK